MEMYCLGDCLVFIQEKQKLNFTIKKLQNSTSVAKTNLEIKTVEASLLTGIRKTILMLNEQSIENKIISSLQRRLYKRL